MGAINLRGARGSKRAKEQGMSMKFINLIPAIYRMAINSIKWKSISNALWVFNYEKAEILGK